MAFNFSSTSGSVTILVFSRASDGVFQPLIPAVIKARVVVELPLVPSRTRKLSVLEPLSKLSMKYHLVRALPGAQAISPPAFVLMLPRVALASEERALLLDRRPTAPPA